MLLPLIMELKLFLVLKDNLLKKITLRNCLSYILLLENFQCKT